MKYNFYIIALFIIFFSGCGKKAVNKEQLVDAKENKESMAPAQEVDTIPIVDLTPSLPEKTSEGKNTFGFVANGINWVPFATLSNADKALCIIQKNSYFDLKATRIISDTSKTYFTVIIDNKIKTGVNYFDPNLIYLDFKKGSNKRYLPSFKFPGKFIFTKIDSVNKIVSGEFAFAMILNSEDTIKIKDGRFDLTFDYCQ